MFRRYQLTIELEADNIAKGQDEIEKTVRALGYSVLETKHLPRTRTERQNKALHKYFELLSYALNEAGMDIRDVISEKVDIPFTPLTVKEYLWRPIQKAYLKKESTTQLTAQELDKIYDILNKIIGERTGVFVPFPCKEAMEEEAIK